MSQYSTCLVWLAAATTALGATAAEAARPVFGAYARAHASAYGALAAEDDGAAAAPMLAAQGEGQGSAITSRVSGTTSGYGSAALQDGQLHSFSAAIGMPKGSVGMSTMVRFWDTVTFHNGQNMGLLASTGLRIDGVLAGPQAGAWYRYYDGAAPADFFERLDHYAPARPLTSGTTLVDDGLTIPLGTSTRFYFMELYTYASAREGQESVADFGNTLHFTWTLPPGVSYGSASGEFMTAVPEAGGGAMLAAGLAAMSGLVRLRRGRLRRAPSSTALG